MAVEVASGDLKRRGFGPPRSRSDSMAQWLVQVYENCEVRAHVDWQKILIHQRKKPIFASILHRICNAKVHANGRKTGSLFAGLPWPCRAC